MAQIVRLPVIRISDVEDNKEILQIVQNSSESLLGIATMNESNCFRFSSFTNELNRYLSKLTYQIKILSEVRILKANCLFENFNFHSFLLECNQN